MVNRNPCLPTQVALRAPAYSRFCCCWCGRACACWRRLRGHRFVTRAGKFLTFSQRVEPSFAGLPAREPRAAGHYAQRDLPALWPAALAVPAPGNGRLRVQLGIIMRFQGFGVRLLLTRSRAHMEGSLWLLSHACRSWVLLLCPFDTLVCVPLQRGGRTCCRLAP